VNRDRTIAQNTYGFTLIEITAALLIGSLLTMSLYQIFRNIQRSVARMTSAIEIDSPIITFYNQLERDILGIFTPRNIKEKKATGPKQDNQEKKIENVFVSSNKNGRVSFNFITTGGYQLIDGSGNAVLAPYNKRVFYSIEPDGNRQNMFILTYGQTHNLDAEITPHIKKYELAKNIRRFDIEFKVIEPTKQAEKESAKKQRKLIHMTQFSPKEVSEKYHTHIPAYIEIKGAYLDPRTNFEVPFKYIFQVPAYIIPEVPKESEKQAAATQQNQKKAQENSAQKAQSAQPSTQNKQTQNGLAGFMP
jgi:prepilin-type N-terminal cleavage/methylation domain-containing protein